MYFVNQCLLFIRENIVTPFLFHFRLTKEQFALINVSNSNNTPYLFFISRWVIIYYFYIAMHIKITSEKNFIIIRNRFPFFTYHHHFIINPIIKPNGVWNTKVQIPLGLIFYVVIFLFMLTYFLVILHIKCANLYFFHLQYWYRTLFCLRLLRIGARPWESEKRKIV